MLVKDFSDAVVTDTETDAYVPWNGAPAGSGGTGLVVEHLDHLSDTGVALLTFCFGEA
jgi:hypothetical protein